MSTLPPKSSPFSHIIDTYAVPTLEQKESIQKFISTQLTPELEEIKRQHKCARLVVRELEGKIGLLEVAVASHEATFSPWRRVLPDIWRIIFTIVVSSEAQPRFESWPGDMKDSASEVRRLKYALRNRLPIAAPFTLARVCRKWRQIMLQCHGLWSNIDLCLDPFASDSDMELGIRRNLGPVLNSLRDQIDRSYEADLRIAFWVCWENPGLAVFDRIADLLYPHMHRFRDIWLPPFLSDRFPGPFPHLRSAALDFRNDLDIVSLSQRPLMQGAGLLTSVNIQLPGGHKQDDFPLTFPCSQLVSIDLGQMYDTITRRFITQVMPQLTANIVDITLDVSSFSPPWDDYSATSFIMPSLKSLSLTAWASSADYIESIISCFKACPSLQSLYIKAMSLPASPIIALLRRSRCSLTSFAIVSAMETTSDYAEVARQETDAVRQLLSEKSVYAGLQELTVSGFHAALDIDDLCGHSPNDFLTPRPSHRVLLSNIQRLTLLHRNVVLDGAFSEFLEASCRHKLRYLKLEDVRVYRGGKEFWDAGELKRELERFVSMGLQLEVVFGVEE